MAWYINVLTRIAEKNGLISADDVADAKKSIENLITTLAENIHDSFKLPAKETSPLLSFESLLSIVTHFETYVKMNIPLKESKVKFSDCIDDSLNYKNKEAIAKLNFILIPVIIVGHKETILSLSVYDEQKGEDGEESEYTVTTNDFVDENHKLRIGKFKSINLDQVIELEKKHVIATFSEILNTVSVYIASRKKDEDINLPTQEELFLSWIKSPVYLSNDDQIELVKQAFDFKEHHLQYESRPFLTELMNINPDVKEHVTAFLRKRLEDLMFANFTELASYINNIEFRKSDNNGVEKILNDLAEGIQRQAAVRIQDLKDENAFDSDMTLEEIASFFQIFKYRTGFDKTDPDLVANSNELLTLAISLFNNLPPTLAYTLLNKKEYEFLRKSSGFEEAQDMLRINALKKALDKSTSYEDLRDENNVLTKILDNNPYTPAFRLVISFKRHSIFHDPSEDYARLILRSKIKNDVQNMIDDIKNTDELQRLFRVLQFPEFNFLRASTSETKSEAWESIIKSLIAKAVTLAEKEPAEERKQYASFYQGLSSLSSDDELKEQLDRLGEEFTKPDISGPKSK